MYQPAYEVYDMFGGPMHGHQRVDSPDMQSLAVEEADVAYIYVAVGAALFYSHVCTLVRCPRPAQDEMPWVWTT